MFVQGLPDNIHFIGIGGAGMSGLADILLALGYRVSGSDLRWTHVTERLASLGARIYTGHRPGNLNGVQMVVVSSAIPPTNPELVEARRRGIPVIHRGEMLSRLMSRQKGIVVAGAHGKTTTTSMMAIVMEKNGLDPTILIGGELTDIGGNAKLGRGSYLVAEADESDGSFLKLDPLVEIITNIEDDHLDHYGSLENIKKAFGEFLARVPDHGTAVVCLDDPNVREVIQTYGGPLITYSLGYHGADYQLRELQLNGTGSCGDVFYRGTYLGRLRLAVPGRHNLSNALAVVAAGRWLGLSFARIASALADFCGVKRRFEIIGRVNGVLVVDDYAHHPTEIKATLQAARQVHRGRLICVFQPHRYTRTALLYEKFGRSFDDADLIVISEIYSAGEEPIEGVDAGLIVKAVERDGRRPVVFLPAMEEIVDYLIRVARPGDLVLTMGAGNIWMAGVELVKKLEGCVA